MKKVISLLLILVLVFSLAACGGETSDNDDSGKNSGSGKKENNKITFTELVAVDNDDCLIKITDIDPDNFWGYTLKVQLENKSADKTYMFSVESAAINGVMSDPYFAADVAAGKKSNSEISFSSDDLAEYGIEDFTDIELTFRVYDYNDWSAEAVAYETVHVYPYGEDKATKFVRESKSTDNVLIDNEYITATVIGYEMDEIWGYTVKLFLVNKTADKEIMFTVDDTSVNDYMMDPLFANTVIAGKCKFATMSWTESAFEENSITDVEKIEFTLRAYDSNDWFAGNLANEAVTLNP